MIFESCDAKACSGHPIVIQGPVELHVSNAKVLGTIKARALTTLH